MKCIKSRILIICLLLLSGSAWSQNAALLRAERYMKNFNFAAAAENYKKAVAKSPDDISIKEKLARVYVLMEDHVNAEALYAQIVKIPASQSVNKLYYGLELRSNGKYDEAAKQFNEYARLAPADPRGKELSGTLDAVKELAIDNKIYTIENLASQNSPASEMGVAFYNGGIIYSSNKGTDVGIVKTDDWTGRRFYDIYSAARQGDGLAAPTRLGGFRLNKSYHEGPAVVSADGKELYFTQSDNQSNSTNSTEDKTIKLRIMHADWDSSRNEWVNTKEINLVNEQYSVGHPALSKDGKSLYFMSDMPGGQGETDLYVSHRDAGNNWGPPVNLGTNVNTKGRELFPYIGEDGTLFFASDGHVGLGGLDIYSATLAGGVWGNTQNLGAPINTSADDFGYIIDLKSKIGYLVSNRPGGLGDDDIYKFKKSGVSLCGYVIDAGTKNTLTGVEVRLLDGDKVVATKSTGPKGEFCFMILENKNYKVTAKLKSYQVNSTDIYATRINQTVQISLSQLGGIDLAVCVNQKGKGTLEGASVELTNRGTGEKTTCVVTSTCKCTFDLEPDFDYKICATKESADPKAQYEIACKTISTRGKTAPGSVSETLDLIYLEENATLKLDNLYFDAGKWNIRADATAELEKLLQIMQHFPKMVIEIGSHTDCHGTMASNDELSTKRARACMDYLLAHGISESRMTAVGYGEHKLVNNCACEGAVESNCTEEQHQQNRRTEFKIIKLQ